MCASTSRRLPSQSVCQTSRSRVSRCSTRPGPGGECGEQVELGAGQVDDGAVDPHLAALLVHLELGEPADRLLGRSSGVGGCGLAGEAQHRLHARDELAGRERLGHVPVGADGQTDQQIDLLGAGGQHQDVALGLGADLAAHLGAVGVRAAPGPGR